MKFKVVWRSATDKNVHSAEVSAIDHEAAELFITGRNRDAVVYSVQHENALTDYVLRHTKRPNDFAYYGDLEFEGWASCFGQHRDSGSLERSNFQTIAEDLERRFPNDVRRESYNHWAVGWVETLRVRVYQDSPNLFGVPIYSMAIHAAFDWFTKLENYPVADEEHLSELEMEESLAFIESESNLWPDSIERPEDWSHLVWQEMECSDVDDIRYEELERTASEVAAEYFYRLNYVNEDQLAIERI